MVNHFDEAPCLYFSLADDGTILEVNDRLCQSLGYQKSELIGQKSDLIFTLPTRIFQQTHFFPLLKMQGHADEIFISLLKKDGAYLPVLINAQRKTVADRACSFYAGIVVHNRQKFEEELIAARKAAEAALHENSALAKAKQELQKQTEELEQKIQTVNKQNEELRQFNRVVTHDIQEPLRKLAVFSGMLSEADDQAQQQALVGKIRRVMTQMTNVVSGLQQYVWLTETAPKPVPIAFDQLLSALQPKLQEAYPQVALVLETTELQSFTADQDQMQLLFYQLLSNAIRFRKDAHQAFVNISTQTLRLNRFRNVEGKYEYVTYLRIQVQDKGIGFDREYKAQVFELFKRLHKDGGQGVGLALCKKVVDNHQGIISIDSVAGEGSLVTILLPVGGSDATTPEPGEV